MEAYTLVDKEGKTRKKMKFVLRLTDKSASIYATLSAF